MEHCFVLQARQYCPDLFNILLHWTFRHGYQFNNIPVSAQTHREQYPASFNPSID